MVSENRDINLLCPQPYPLWTSPTFPVDGEEHFSLLPFTPLLMYTYTYTYEDNLCDQVTEDEKVEVVSVDGEAIDLLCAA